MQSRVPKFVAGVLAAALLGCSGGAAAVSPQWVVNVENRIYTQEKPAGDLGASWASLSDGSQLLAVFGRQTNPAVLLRRIDPQGGVSDITSQDDSQNRDSGGPRILLAATASGAFVVNSSNEEIPNSRLRLLATDGSEQWSLPLPANAADGDGPAVALRALADGSAVVLRKRSVMKVDAGGQVRWHFGNGNNDHLLLDQAALLVDTNGVTWVGGGGGLRLGADNYNFAAVRRFDAAGALVSLGLLLCDTCSRSRVLGLAELANREIVAVGRSAAGEPGFVAFYSIGGTQRLRVNTAPDGGYDHVVTDAANNVYALSRDRRTISAINIADGSVRWQKPGSDLTALPDGVLITQAPASGNGELSIAAFDANGNPLWSRQLEASDGSAAGGARVEAGVIRLVSMVERTTPDCGLSPSLVTLDAAGNLVSETRACTIAHMRHWNDISSNSQAGAVGNLNHRMLRFSPLGETVWEYAVCPLCGPYQSTAYTTASLLMPDATTWITTRRVVAAPAATEYALLHLAADGSLLSETALPEPGPNARSHETRLLADTSQVIVLVPRLGGLSLNRVSAAGTLLGSASYTLPGGHEEVARPDGRLWPDGSISLVSARQYDWLYCTISPPQPQCGPPSNTVLRINADNSERWRVELERAWLTASIEDDASHVVLISAHEPGESVRMQRIDAGGMLGAAISIADTMDGFVGPVIGPVRGRYLVSVVDGHRLIDAGGTLLATTTGTDYYSTAMAYAQPGFIVSSGSVNGRLMSADDLAELAVFDIDTPESPPPDDTRWEDWSLSDDGSVYMTEWPNRRNGFRPRLARFAVPGSPADDIIFIDRF